MPELPEVERTRLSLAPLIGRTITTVTLRRADICDSFNALGTPHKSAPRDLLAGAKISSLTRKGKQLAIHASDGRTLCIQLGMSGTVRLLQPSTQDKGTQDSFPAHTHAVWFVDNYSQLLFIDPRRFGGLSTYPTESALHQHRWSALGPDALTITARDLAHACEHSHRPIKSLLLDQSALAGVGNIYADESLFRAHIHPAAHASTLTKPQLTSLARAIRFILARAIKAGGSTLRNYADSAGTAGNAQSLHAVYARANLPCTNCSHPLRGTRLAQRATVFCPACQPPPPKPRPQMKPA
ncbi:MAG: bifunctional DNA-formamidopyrimidine glycosylase/DNA-(apurinic or apyrimidinic site) lyase [Phycisphaerae bacterium]|nr:bifunctional DNA-formamidopyrimidine glycosylase/DNA-(apurinic or apyrimidinic site) lyase [Phycisphaerae bacterium]